MTDKFWAIRETIGKYLPLPPVPANLVNVTKKGEYGSVEMKFVSSILPGVGKLHKSRYVISNVCLNSFFELKNHLSGLSPIIL